MADHHDHEHGDQVLPYSLQAVIKLIQDEGAYKEDAAPQTPQAAFGKFLSAFVDKCKVDVATAPLQTMTAAEKRQALLTVLAETALWSTKSEDLDTIPSKVSKLTGIKVTRSENVDNSGIPFYRVAIKIDRVTWRLDTDDCKWINDTLLPFMNSLDTSAEGALHPWDYLSSEGCYATELLARSVYARASAAASAAASASASASEVTVVADVVV